ncbi:MAG: TorF family putative porin [Gammaproteobacteria bacterium]
MTHSVRTALIGITMASSIAAPNFASAGSLSGNIGVLSDYFFRGIDQGAGAIGTAGLDYDFGNGLAIGTWGGDVGDGLEVDVYGSYSGEASGFAYGVGFTTYNYTGEFDDSYQEINLSAGYGPVSLAYAMGTYDSSPSQDYTFTSLTLEQGGVYATLGAHGKDFDGSYVELGYGAEVSGLDLGVSIISADEDLSVVDQDGDSKNDAEVSMVFSLSKSFDIGGK